MPLTFRSLAVAVTALGLAAFDAHQLALPLFADAPAPVASASGRLEGLKLTGPTAVPGALVADARMSVKRVKAFRTPWGDRPFMVFDNPDQYRTRRVFLVKEVRDDRVLAYLPMRPNGATGWLRSRDVVLRSTDYRMEVDLSRNLLTIWDGDRRIMHETVAAGTGGTPTPTGLFYTTIEYRTADPGGVYGPYIIGLSAYSEVLFTFNGGDGQIGIHGTNSPGLLGSDVSHGCIRMRNEAITKMVRLLPLGTPVDIRP